MWNSTRKLIETGIVLALAGGIACAAERKAIMELNSIAFGANADIPSLYTCEGRDVSPPLAWTGVPAGTKSLALIVDDPDAPAGVWTHWVVYNLPAQTKSLDENVPKQAKVLHGGFQGLSSFGSIGYGGPCPPPGSAHRYFFRLYALDTMLNLQAGALKQKVFEAMKGHILGQAQLMGRFKR